MPKDAHTETSEKQLDGMMFFSIVIPLFNKEAHIQRAIDSVLAQTETDYELIVIDDGSTDESARIVKSYVDKRIKLIQQKNIGNCGARNRGIMEAKADFIAFLDADDAWMPTFLKTIKNLIKKYPYAGAYATGIKTIGVKGQVVKKKIRGIPDSAWEGLIPDLLMMMSYGPLPISGSSSCFPKYTFENVGLFPVDVHRYGDADLWLRMSFRYKLAYTTKTCAVYYRDVENSISNTVLLDSICIENTLKKGREQGYIKKALWHYCDDIVSMLIYRNALRYLINGRKEGAREWAHRMRSKRMDLLIKKAYIVLLSFCSERMVKKYFSFSNIKPIN